MRRSSRSTINSALVGTSQADFNRHPVGERSSQAEDFSNGNGAVEKMAELNSSLAELGSAIFSRRFSAADAADLLSEDSADARRRPNAAPTWKPTSWSHWKKLFMVRLGQFRCAAPVRTKWKIIRSKSRAAFMKANESAWRVKVKRAYAEGKVAISFCACVWRNIPTSQSRAAIWFTR